MEASLLMNGGSAAERRVRTLVAEQLGVDPDALVPEISLTDELAADSLDLVELTMRLEDELGVRLSDDAMDGVRTYRELVGVVAGALPASSWVEALSGAPFRAAVVSADGGTRVERAEPLTPYALQTVGDDAAHAGPGARLEVTVPSPTAPRDLATLRERFAWLRGHGVTVSIRRARSTGRPVPAVAAAAP